MMTNPRVVFTAADAKARAAECRILGEQSRYAAHRLMLMHIAGTWEKIAFSLQDGHGPSIQDPAQGTA